MTRFGRSDEEHRAAVKRLIAKSAAAHPEPDPGALVARAEELAGKATPGPWKQSVTANLVIGPNEARIAVCPSDDSSDDDDVAFIAASRTLVPDFCALVRQYQAEIERLKQERDHWKADHNEMVTRIGELEQERGEARQRIGKARAVAQKIVDWLGYKPHAEDGITMYEAGANDMLETIKGKMVDLLAPLPQEPGQSSEDEKEGQQ